MFSKKANNFDLPILEILKQILLLPRSSENSTEKIKDFLVKFAKENKLEYNIDKFDNVIIYKNVNSETPIILHTHTDDVIKRSNRLWINGIANSLIKRGSYLSGKDCSLGIESAASIALILDVLLNPNIKSNIEAIFTSNYYNNMKGANNIDIKRLNDKSLISFSNAQNQNKLLTSSLGYSKFSIKFKPERYFISSNINTKTYKLSLSGLEFGKFNDELGRNRTSAIKLLIQLLQKLGDVKLNSFDSQEDAFFAPTKAECIFTTENAEREIKRTIKYFYLQVKKDFKNIKIKCSRQLNKTLIVKNGNDFLTFIAEFKQGVLARSQNENVLSLQNLCLASLDKGELEVGIWYDNEKSSKQLMSNLKSLCDSHGLELKLDYSLPIFNSLEDSQLLAKFKKAKQILPISNLCSCSEVGIFQQRIKKLDAVIVSPKVENQFTIEESIDIKSFLTLKDIVEEVLNP